LRPLGGYQPIASVKATTNMGGSAMNRPRAADDFTTIRARMEELRRERKKVEATDSAQQRDAPTPRGVIRWPPSEICETPGRVRRSSPERS
jgi:hypothetical protein